MLTLLYASEYVPRLPLISVSGEQCGRKQRDGQAFIYRRLGFGPRNAIHWRTENVQLSHFASDQSSTQ
jgi:hypothetical protein